jgi:ATP-dependent RNA helicase DDX35
MNLKECLEWKRVTCINVFSAFIEKKDDDGWCKNKNLNYKSLQKALKIRQQLLTYFPSKKSKNLPFSLLECVQRSFLAGYFSNVAKSLDTGSYKLLSSTAEEIFIHPDSVLFRRVPKYICFIEIIETTKTFARNCISVEKNWVLEEGKSFYESKRKNPIY